MSASDSCYQSILKTMGQAHSGAPLSRQMPQLIAVSKQQPEARIERLLAAGHRQFGENRVQEAQTRWTERRKLYPNLRLHGIGPVQSNKIGAAVALFDFIHTLDREKLALGIAQAQEEQGRQIACFIQINIGDEPQKSGINAAELEDFLSFCRHDAGLNILGLMAIPPENSNPHPYFALMYQLARRHGLNELSMGMSGDFEAAIRFGATFIRLGTAVFGAREAG